VGDPGLSVETGTATNPSNRAAIAFSASNPAGPYAAAGVAPPERGLAHWNGSAWIVTGGSDGSSYTPLVDLAFSADSRNAFLSYGQGPEVLPFTVGGPADPFSSILSSDPVTTGIVAADSAVAVDRTGNPVVALATSGSNPTVLVYEYENGRFIPYAGEPQPVLGSDTRVVRSVDIAIDAVTGQPWVAATLALTFPFDAVTLFTWQSGTGWTSAGIGFGLTAPLTHASLVLGPNNSGAPTVAWCRDQGGPSQSLVTVVSVDPSTFVATSLDDISRSENECLEVQHQRLLCSLPAGSGLNLLCCHTSSHEARSTSQLVGLPSCKILDTLSQSSRALLTARRVAQGLHGAAPRFSLHTSKPALASPTATAWCSTYPPPRWLPTDGGPTLGRRASPRPCFHRQRCLGPTWRWTPSPGVCGWQACRKARLGMTASWW
jgi:hypothetical protein